MTGLPLFTPGQTPSHGMALLSNPETMGLGYHVRETLRGIMAEQSSRRIFVFLCLNLVSLSANEYCSALRSRLWWHQIWSDCATNSAFHLYCQGKLWWDGEFTLPNEIGISTTNDQYFVKLDSLLFLSLLIVPDVSPGLTEYCFSHKIHLRSLITMINENVAYLG